MPGARKPRFAWADFRGAPPFPYKSDDIFYSHHVIEHLADLSLPFHFKEMFRCLKPGGFIRVGGPHRENVLRLHVEGVAAWFSDFADKCSSIGGRLVNCVICRGEHLTILTPSYLEKIATGLRFVNVKFCAPCREPFHAEMFDGSVLSKDEEVRNCPKTLMIEAEKPK